MVILSGPEIVIVALAVGFGVDLIISVLVRVFGGEEYDPYGY